MDLIYEGITTGVLCSFYLALLVRMDLIYEGITTNSKSPFVLFL